MEEFGLRLSGHTALECQCDDWSLKRHGAPDRASSASCTNRTPRPTQRYHTLLPLPHSLEQRIQPPLPSRDFRRSRRTQAVDSALVHAGVVFWHVRLYSVNGFYEPTAVAFAALMFWALSAFSPKKTTPAKGSRRGGGTSSSESSPSADVCDIILIDRPTDDELVQQFVRQGNNMRVNITGVGDLFGPKGARRVLMEGQKLLLTLGSWRGISNYWLRVLNRLEKVTAAADVNLAPAEENVSAG